LKVHFACHGRDQHPLYHRDGIDLGFSVPHGEPDPVGAAAVDWLVRRDASFSDVPVAEKHSSKSCNTH